MPGSMPATSQLDWLSSMTAMIVLFWSRATRDLLKSFGWGIAGTPSITYSDEVAISRRPPHSIYRSLPRGIALAAAQRGGMPVGHLGMTPWPRGKAPRSIGVDKAAAS